MDPVRKEVIWHKLELYVPTSGWNTAESVSSRDEGLQRKAVLMSRLVGSLMPNVDRNLGLEYPNLLVPVSPLSRETNHAPSGCVCISAEGN